MHTLQLQGWLLQTFKSATQTLTSSIFIFSIALPFLKKKNKIKKIKTQHNIWQFRIIKNNKNTHYAIPFCLQQKAPCINDAVLTPITVLRNRKALIFFVWRLGRPEYISLLTKRQNTPQTRTPFCFFPPLLNTVSLQHFTHGCSKDSLEKHSIFFVVVRRRFQEMRLRSVMPDVILF